MFESSRLIFTSKLYSATFFGGNKELRPSPWRPCLSFLMLVEMSTMVLPIR